MQQIRLGWNLGKSSLAYFPQISHRPGAKLHDTTDVAEGLIALCSHEHVLVCPKYGVPKILVISYHHVPH